MTKRDLIEKLAAQNSILSQGDAELIVNTIFDSMTEALAKGDRIEVRGFGSFHIRKRKARQGRNPRTGEPVPIEAKKVLFFKVGRELKKRVDSN